MEPEQTLSTRMVFDGKIVRIRVDTVGLPSGREAVREVVEHQAAVVVVPIDQEDNILLVRQYRYPVGESLLEAPAGGVEDAETPEACAQREIREEVGYGARDLRPLAGFWLAPGYSTEFMHAFVARDLAPDRLEPDDDENILVERVPMSRVPDLIHSGEIRDAKTIAALLLVTSGFGATDQGGGA